jgi:hypothetical protein
MMTATHAQELTLRLPVHLVDISASRALTTRVPRIDDVDRNPSKFRLVGQERSQLEERPTHTLGSLISPYRCPTLDMRKFF